MGKEGFVLVHTWPFHTWPFQQKKKHFLERSLSSRFSVALKQTSLSSPINTSLCSIGCFNIPSSYAQKREHKSRRFRKKTRANAVSIHGKLVLSREIALARYASRSRFPLTLLRRIMKSRYEELTSVKKNENESKSSLEIHPKKPTRDT